MPASARLSAGADWALCATAPGEVATPDALAASGDRAWLAIDGPQTVASALQRAGRWSPDEPSQRLDGQDWWFRATLRKAADGGPEVIGFDGLATLSEAWVDGQPLLASDSMFIAHERPLPQAGGCARELLIRCRSLDAALAATRGRPRWRAPMIEHQQLRGFRTTVLGRTPGWSPPAPAIGPWRGVWTASRRGLHLDVQTLRTHLEPGRGRLELSGRLQAGRDAPLPASVVAEICLAEGDGRPLANANARLQADGRFTLTIDLPFPALWWPHTHGEPALHRVRVLAGHGARLQRFELGTVGFRTVDVDRGDDGFRVRVNGVEVFCRGACWTPLDPIGFATNDAALHAAVAQCREGGMNMLRVAGNMVYEEDAFFDACDAHGVLVWQEFMFANMDVPQSPALNELIEVEAAQQLRRWQRHPSIAVVCGNSEVAQQAAMSGAPRAHWAMPLFDGLLRERTESALPGTPYQPSSAWGGAFPHQPSAGTCSYYGVGAYQRPLDDLRRSRVRFASECLAYANLPDDAALARLGIGTPPQIRHPLLRAHSPRDLDAGWDFEDIRDHALHALLGVDPAALRRSDAPRYLALSRVATGLAMQHAFTEWRRPQSDCGGGLVWFLRDLWAGAGWGLLDETGAPKAAWQLLAPVLQPVWVGLTDEGLNGFHAHVVNERPQPLRGQLVIEVLRDDASVLARSEYAVALAPHAAVTLAMADAMDGFVDVNHAYQFGPRAASVVHARLLRDDGAPIDAWHCAPGPVPACTDDARFDVAAMPAAGGGWEVELSAGALALWVEISLPGHRADAQFFHLRPGQPRRLRLLPIDGSRPGSVGRVTALNARHGKSFTAAVT